MSNPANEKKTQEQKDNFDMAISLKFYAWSLNYEAINLIKTFKNSPYNFLKTRVMSVGHRCADRQENHPDIIHNPSALLPAQEI